ncbi:MAG: hypothetical protein R2754_02350 [Microthrixaceae bacterium]
MILTDRDRRLVYDGLSQVISDEKALNNLLANFAIRESDEPASKHYIDARISEAQLDIGGVRSELAETEARLVLHMSEQFNGLRDDLRAEMRIGDQALREEITELRAELKGDIAELRAELKGDISDLRAELKGDIAELRTELKGDIAELRAELKGDISGLEAGFTGLRTELKGDISDLRAELKGDIAELRAEIKALTHKMYGGLLVVCAAIIGSQAFF